MPSRVIAEDNFNSAASIIALFQHMLGSTMNDQRTQSGWKSEQLIERDAHEIGMPSTQVQSIGCSKSGRIQAHIMIGFVDGIAVGRLKVSNRTQWIFVATEVALSWVDEQRIPFVLKRFRKIAM